MDKLARACCTWSLLAALGCGSAAEPGGDGTQVGGAAGSSPGANGGSVSNSGAGAGSSAGLSADGGYGAAGSAGAVTSGGVSGSVSSAGATNSAGGTNSSGGSNSGGAAAMSGSANSAGAANVAGAAGAISGGSSSCDWSAPPANVAAWVDESWKSELGNNIRTRKAWTLDNVMLNKGEMNLCVRWGATSAVPATVRMNLAGTAQRWFNDWFKALGTYGCFPYANGIAVKVTGWAVKPGQQALLSGVDPAIPVYTETDADGEPKCPDACSSFVHWDHQFPNCAGGAANHSDYWLWFDDTLPGGGGAAAVGGDWGLRMPVSTFVDHFNDPSFLICEHEMGHGVGFQDYYTWKGSTPAGGSLMIVGSTAGKQSPTTGDTWLLRRTWQEMSTLRSWR